MNAVAPTSRSYCQAKRFAQRSRRAGFTLLELIVATTITILVTGSTVLLVGNLTAAQGRIDRQAELQQEARIAANMIATALRNAYRPPAAHQPQPHDWPLLEGTSDMRDDLANDQVRLLSVSHRTIRPGEPEADVHEVAFRLLDVVDRAEPVLTRRTDPALNEPDDAGGVLDRLAHNVVSLELSYFDGRRWQQDWHSHDHGWPVAVRVRLLLVSDPDVVPTTRWAVTRLINFPHHHPTVGRVGGDRD